MEQKGNNGSSSPSHPEKRHSAKEHQDKIHRSEKITQTGVKDSAHSRRSQKLAAQRAMTRKRLVYKVITIGIILVFLSIFGLTVTSTNTFCGGCHEMKPDFASWQESPHRNVKCVQCHIGPGFFNLIAHKISSLKSLYYHFSNDYEKPINADGSYAEEIKNEYCLQCHEGILETKVVEQSRQAEVKSAHDKHLNLDLKCAVCHNRVAHKIKGYKDNLKMKACQSCHQGSSANSNCNLCHSDRFLLNRNQ